MLGTRIISPTLLVATTGGNPTFFDATWHLTARLARKAYAVRAIFSGYAASATVGVTCAASAVDESTDMSSSTAALNNAGTWVTGAGTTTVAARSSATRQTWTMGPWIELPTPSKLVALRAIAPASGNTEASVMRFDQNSALTAGRIPGWSTVAGDEYFCRRQSGDFITDPTGMTSPTTTEYSLLVGIQYLTTEGIINIAGVGDSIMAGTFSTLAYDSYFAKAVRSLKVAGYPVECSNLGWTGQASSIYYLRALDAIQALSLQHMVYSPWTPNDVAATPTDLLVTAMRARWAQVVQQGRAYNCNVVPCTGIPRATGTFATSYWDDAEDLLRRTLNAEVRGKLRYVDADAAVAANTALTGSASGFASSTYPAADLLHLSETGNAQAAQSVATQIQQLIGG